MSELHDAIRRAMEAQGTPEPEPPPPEPPKRAAPPPPEQGTLFEEELQGGEPPEPGMVRAGAPVFDREASNRARDAGMAQADAAANPDWKADANRAVMLLIARGEEFTGDEVWAEVGYFPRERRALGPLMKRFADSGAIVDTGKRRKSTRPEHHSYPMTVWRPA
jgi:hypothetical protein